MKLSLFSVSYAGYWGQDSLDLGDFIGRAAQLGYDSVMIAGKRPHLSILDSNEERIAATRSALDQHGMTCTVIAGYNDLGPVAAAEVPYLEMQIAYVESLSRIASQVGAGIVRIFTAYEVDGCPPHSVWKTTVRTIQEMCDRAAHYDVTLAIQNHHDIGVHSDALLELLFDIGRPNCRLGADAWSPALRGEDVYEAAKKLAPHTAITTNADYIQLPRYRYRPELVNYQSESPGMVRAVQFGDGFIDYEAFFRGLVDGGFDGVANFEMCSPVRGGGSMANLDAFAGQYVSWMREHNFA